MAPASRTAVMDTALSGLFAYETSADGNTHTVRAGGISVSLPTPGNDYLKDHQLKYLRSEMDLRGDRLPEILQQIGDLLSFYGSQVKLDGEGRRWTMEVLGLVYRAVVKPEQYLKYLCNVPRPIDFTPKVQPIIQTPSHSSYPSGHATEAFVFATILVILHRKGKAPAGTRVVPDILRELVRHGANPDAAERDVQMLFSLAARIANNRTVAGVHFPIDSADGALLGLGMALALADKLFGEGITLDIQGFDETWNGAFEYDDWRAKTRDQADLSDPDDAVTPDADTSADRNAAMLRAIGDRALSEWR